MNQYFVDETTGSDSTGDGSIGNPWASIQHAIDNIVRDTTDGDQITIKSATLSAPLNVMTTYGGGSGQAPLVFSGYSAAANDKGLGDVDANGNSLFAATAYSFIVLKDLDCHNFGTSEPIHLNAYCIIDNCVVRDSTHTSYAVDLSIGSKLINTHIYGHAAAGGISISSGIVDCCRIEAASGTGLYSLGNSIISNNVVLYSGSGSAIATGGVGKNIRNNTIIQTGANQGSGIYLVNTSSYCILVDANYIEGFATGILSPTSALNHGIIRSNRLFNNSTPTTINGPFYVEEDNTTTSASGVVDLSGGDFTPTSELLLPEIPIGGRHVSGQTLQKYAGAVQVGGGSGGGGGGNIAVAFRRGIRLANRGVK